MSRLFGQRDSDGQGVTHPSLRSPDPLKFDGDTRPRRRNVGLQSSHPLLCFALLTRLAPHGWHGRARAAASRKRDETRRDDKDLMQPRAPGCPPQATRVRCGAVHLIPFGLAPNREATRGSRRIHLQLSPPPSPYTHLLSLPSYRLTDRPTSNKTSAPSSILMLTPSPLRPATSASPLPLPFLFDATRWTISPPSLQ